MTGAGGSARGSGAGADPASDAGLARTVLAYYLYQASASFGFLIPVWVVLLEDRGLSLTAVTLLDSVFFATLVLAELPTGYLGDRLGRRQALALGSFGLALSAAGFGLARSVPAFLVVYVAWGVAQTLRSGNDSAWLYDSLAARGEAGAFGRIRSRGLALFFGANAVTAVAGGALYVQDPVYPFLATGAMQAVSGVVALGFPPAGAGDGERFSVADARRAVRRLARPGLRRFVAYAAFLFAIGWSADVFVQPIGVRAGLDPVGLGALYAGFTGVSAVTTFYADAVAVRLGVGRVVHLAPLVLGGVLLGLGATPLAFVPAVLVLRVVLNGASPVVETYLNDHTSALGRATTLSAFSMAVSLASIPLKLASGPLADATSPFVAVAALGGLMVLVAAGLLALGGSVVEEPTSGAAVPEADADG